MIAPVKLGLFYLPAKVPGTPPEKTAEPTAKPADSKAPKSPDHPPSMLIPGASAGAGSVSSPIGGPTIMTPAIGGLDAEEVQKLLDFLETAKNNITKKVNDTIKRNEQEGKMEEAKVLKKKLDNFQKKIDALKVRIEQLRHISKPTADEIKAIRAAIEALKTEAYELNGDALAKGFEGEGEIGSGKINELVKEIEDKIDALEKNASDKNTVFGSFWREIVPPGINDVNGLSSQGYAWFKEHGLLEIAKDKGLDKVIKRVARAKLEFAILVGAKIKEDGGIDGAVGQAFDEALKLAAAGKLTLDELNEIVGKLKVGLHFNAASFAQLLEGSGADKFLNHVDNLFYSVLFSLSIEFEHLPNLSKIDKRTCREIHAAAIQYSGEKDFYVIDLKQARERVAGAFNLASPNWAKLMELKLPKDLRSLCEKLDGNGELGVEEKWDRLVLAVLLEARQRMAYDSKLTGSDPQKVQHEKDKKFANFMRKVQQDPKTKEDEASHEKVLRAFESELGRVVYGQAVFDGDKVLNGKGAERIVVPSKPVNSVI